MRNRYIDGVQRNKLNFAIRYPKGIYLFLWLIIIQFLFTITIASEWIIPSIDAWVSCSIRMLGLCFFVFLVRFLKKMHLIVVAAEFQNMFYSNATKALTQFYMIITNELEIIYSDERLKGKRLKQVFGTHYNAITSGIHKGFLYHRFYDGDTLIEVIPMIRPNGYLLISAREITQEKIYNALFEEAKICLYKCDGNTINSRGYEYFENAKVTEEFIDNQSFKSGYIEHEGIVLKNFSKINEGRYYGLLIPLFLNVRGFIAKSSIGIACFSKEIEIIDSNEAFLDIFRNEENISQFLQNKIKPLEIDADCAIVNLTLTNGDIVRGYLSKLYGFTIAFFVELSELGDLQRKFQDSQKRVSLGELSGGIAHDFNNILTAILGFAEIALEDLEMGSKHYYDVAQIKSSAKKGRDLVKKILAFSRNQTLNIEVLNINYAVNSIKQLVERLVPENITLSFHLSPNVHNVKIDKSQFEQSLINLIVNAKDAVEAGGKISVRTENITVKNRRTILAGTQNEEVMLKGEYVKISVSDDGCGISNSIIQKIFDPFFSTKSVDKGTGLGLSTVYGIIRQMNGYIDVETKENKGSTFCIFIPPSYETAEVKNESEYSHYAESYTSTANILLIEDDQMVRKFLVKALKKRGFTITECSDSNMALAVFERMKDELDLIITDVIMPGIDGPEMVAKMREIKDDLKVLFMSGYTRDKLNMSSESKNSGFIGKPFEIHAMLSKVSEMLDR